MNRTHTGGGAVATTWNVERLFAWLRFRRVVTRYERKADNFLGFVHLGCSAILLRRL